MKKHLLMLVGLVIVCATFMISILSGIWNGEQETAANTTENTKEKKAQMTDEDMKRIDTFLPKIHNLLINEGYEELTFSFDHRSNLINVMVGDEAVIHNQGERIKDLIKNYALKENFGKVEVDFQVVKMHVDTKWDELNKELMKVTKETVEKEGYKLVSINFHPAGSDPHIEIEMSGNEDHFERSKSTIIDVVSKIVSKHTEIDLAIRVVRSG